MSIGPHSHVLHFAPFTSHPPQCTFTFLYLVIFSKMQMQSYISSVNFLESPGPQVRNPTFTKMHFSLFIPQIVPFSLFQHLVNFHKSGCRATYLPLTFFLESLGPQVHKSLQNTLFDPQNDLFQYLTIFSISMRTSLPFLISTSTSP
jgi:hypothetical protein